MLLGNQAHRWLPLRLQSGVNLLPVTSRLASLRTLAELRPQEAELRKRDGQDAQLRRERARQMARMSNTSEGSGLTQMACAYLTRLSGIDGTRQDRGSPDGSGITLMNRCVRRPTSGISGCCQEHRRLAEATVTTEEGATPSVATPPSWSRVRSQL